jgi:PAS domain S-box-containing protein
MSNTSRQGKTREQRVEYEAGLLEYVSDAVVSMDMDLVIQSRNKAAEQLYGWTADEAVGRLIVDLLKTEYPKDSREFLIKRLTEAGQYEGEIVHHHRDGTPITVLTSGSVLRNGDGEVTGYVAINRDITDRKKAEEVLRWWGHVFEHLEWGVVIGTDDDVVTQMNPAFARMFGYTVAELVGKPVATLFPQETLEKIPEYVRITIERGHHSFEAVAVRKDGSHFPVLIYLTSVKDKDGTVLYRAVNVFDISERKKAENELKESFERFRTLFDTSREGIVFVHLDGRIELANQAFLDMLGYTLAEVRELTYRDITPEKWAAMEADVAKNKVMKEGYSGEYEKEYFHRDGHVFPVRLRVWLLRDDQGEPLRMLGMVSDITEQKKAEKALKYSERRYRHMFESASVAMFEGEVSALKAELNRLREEGVTDFRTYLVEHPEFVINSVGLVTLKNVNDKSVELFEAADRAELMRSLPRLFLPETFERFREMLIAYAEGREHFESEGVIQTLTGERRHIYTYAAFPPEGAPFDNPLVSIIDFTDRKRTEEALLKTQFAIDHAADALFWIQPDGRIVEVNDATCRYLGYTREELLSMRIRDIDRHNIDWDAEWEAFKEKGSITIESVHVGKDGRRIPVEVVANYLDYHGTEFCCAFVRDITERQELEAQLRQAQKLETIGTLAGGIAHDFNNILGPILGYTDMLLDDQEDGSPIKADLGHILKAANRAKELVQQILLFSRQGEQERKPTQIHLIVREALKLLKATLPSTIEIRQSIDPECGAVLADPTQIHQVLLNLCTNAQHAMRDSDGVLTVGLESFEADEEFVRVHQGLEKGGYVRLIVSDTGHGINASSLEHIFEPFFTTKVVGEGTGLGLSVAHGIVVRHGGTIAVESAPEVGTSFHVFLPSVAEGPAETTSAAVPHTGLNATVLYVEDQQDVAEVGRTMMERIGYKVTLASSGTDALERFREDADRFDLVVTDQTMPGMTGVDLARELLRFRPDLPVVLMTGFSDTVTPASARNLGIRGFIRKPIVTRELAVALHKALTPHTTSLD